MVAGSKSVTWKSRPRPLRAAARKPAKLPALPSASAASGCTMRPMATARNLQRDLARLAVFADLGLVLQLEIQGRQAGGRVAQGTAFDQLRGENQPVHAEAAAPCGAARRSSLSLAFIITDGVVSALSRDTVRWRSTASLKRKPVSSSVSVSLLHSMFRHR